MTKTDIKRQLEAVSGKSFLCVSEIARHMGMGRGIVVNLQEGLDSVPSGREKRYLISDVAERIADRRRSG